MRHQLLGALSLAALIVLPARADEATDDHGDPLPAGATARLGTVRWRHGEGVTDLAFSPDGQRVATTAGSVLSLFDPQGKRVAAWELPAEEGWALEALAWSPDGKSVALGSATAHVVLIDPTSGQRRTFEHDEADLHALRWSPDGAALASLDEEGLLRVWTPQGELRCRIELEDGVYGFAWSPDGQRLALATGQGLAFADPASGLLTPAPPPPAREGQPEEIGPLEQVTWGPGAEGLVAVQAQEVFLFGPDGALGARFEATTELLAVTLALSPDGKTLACGGEAGVVLIDLPGRRERAAVPLEGVEALSFSPDGKRLLVSTYEPALSEVDPQQGALLPGSGGHAREVAELAWHPSGQRLISADAGQVLTWSWPERRPALLHRPADDGGVVGITLSPDGETCALTDMQGLALLDLTGKARGRVGSETSIPVWVAFSPDGRRFAGACSDGALRLWDAAALGEQTLLPPDDEVTLGAVAWSPDGKLLAAVSPQDPHAVDMWDLSGEAPRRLRSLGGATLEVERLAFLPDSRRLLIVGGNARLLQVESGETLRAFDPEVFVEDMALSPDGETLALIHQTRVSLWSVGRGELLRMIEGHLGEVTSAAFAPDGQHLATGSRDTTVLVWRLTAQ